jgi:putative oxidoreductase
MQLLFLLGRVIYGGFFFMSGMNQFRTLPTASAEAAAKGVPVPQAAVTAAGVLNIMGGLSVLFGCYPTLGLACIILFMVPVTFFMHNFWADTDPVAQKANQINFGKNAAITGASLMLLLTPQPWPFSLGWGF